MDHEGYFSSICSLLQPILIKLCGQTVQMCWWVRQLAVTEGLGMRQPDLLGAWDICQAWLWPWIEPCHAPHHLLATPEEEGPPQQGWVTVCWDRHSHHSTDEDWWWGWSQHAAAKQRWGPHQCSSQLLHTALPTANKQGWRGSCILWPAFLV